MNNPDTIAALIIVVFLAIGLHEYAHCKFADMAGDPTPREHGRVTLNLFKHFDPLGAVMILITFASGYGIGWGKPAPINPSKMRNPRWDTFISVLAGPLSNILQAVVWAFLLRIFLPTLTPHSFFAMLCVIGILMNLSLAFFNLIPFGILDGHWLLGLLLPEKLQNKWFLFNRRYGWVILVVFILLSQQMERINPRYDILGNYLGYVTEKGFSLLIGERLKF